MAVYVVIDGHASVAEPGQRHRFGLCHECDAYAVANMTLGEIENWYHQGLLDQDEYEGYMWAWATGAPRFSDHWRSWEREPEFPLAKAFGELLKLISSAKGE